MSEDRPGLLSGRSVLPWVAIGGAILVVLALRVATRGPSITEQPILGVVPSFELVDQQGEAFGSADLAGRIWIASFIYTTCPGPCPRVVQRLHDVERRLQAQPELAIVSFSVDPENDTPSVLAEYGQDHGIDASRWKLLTGAIDSMFDLVLKGFMLSFARAETGDAAALAADGPITHSTRLVLVDRSMRIRGYYESREPAAIERLVNDAQRLARQRSG